MGARFAVSITTLFWLLVHGICYGAGATIFPTLDTHEHVTRSQKVHFRLRLWSVEFSLNRHRSETDHLESVVNSNIAHLQGPLSLFPHPFLFVVLFCLIGLLILVGFQLLFLAF